MKIYKSKGGYFYKENNNKKKIRISKLEYDKIRKRNNKIYLKKNKNFIGGSNSPINNINNINNLKYIKKWQNILYLEKEIDNYNQADKNTLLAYRWGNRKNSNLNVRLPYCKGIELFDGLDGKRFLTEKDTIQDTVDSLNILRREFIYHKNALNVQSVKYFGIFDYIIPYKIKNIKTSESFEVFNTVNNSKYSNYEDVNIVIMLSILLSMLGMFTSFLKTNNKYLLWFQNKAEIRENKKEELFKTIKHFMETNVEGAYIASLNKGNSRNNYYNKLNNEDVNNIPETDISYVDISKLKRRVNPGNVCVLLRRDTIINFLKWWKNGMQLEPKIYYNINTGIPNLSIEDMQFAIYIKNIANCKNFKVVIPFKDPYSRRSDKKNYQSPLIKYNYRATSSYSKL